MAVKKLAVEEVTHKASKKTLAELFHEPCAITVERALMHQAFQVPFAGTESSLSAARISGLKMVYHPGYGLICEHKNKYFLAPSANVIVMHE